MIIRALAMLGRAKQFTENPVVAGPLKSLSGYVATGVESFIHPEDPRPVAGVSDLVDGLFKTANDTARAVPMAVDDTAKKSTSYNSPAPGAEAAASVAQAAKPYTDPFVKAAAPSIAPAVNDDMLSRIKDKAPIAAAVGVGAALIGLAIRKGR